MTIHQTFGHVRYHTDLLQGSDEWLQARCGLLTASELKLILTPTLKAAANDKERSHLYELMAQRITGYVEPQYISDDMLRGYEDEIEARNIYAKTYAPVEEVGFVTNDRWGFTLGCSPDGLVGADGGIECKSRRQKFQTQTVIENVVTGTVPAEYLLQVQGCMLITERQWWDFLSYSGGLPMVVIRAYPDPVVHNAIVETAGAFEARLSEKLTLYRETVAAKQLAPTERKIIQEIY